MLLMEAIPLKTTALWTLIQVPRGDVAEIIVGSVTNEQEIANEISVYENTRLWLCTRF